MVNHPPSYWKIGLALKERDRERERAPSPLSQDIEVVFGLDDFCLICPTWPWSHHLWIFVINAERVQRLCDCKRTYITQNMMATLAALEPQCTTSTVTMEIGPSTEPCGSPWRTSIHLYKLRFIWLKRLNAVPLMPIKRSSTEYTKSVK